MKAPGICRGSSAEHFTRVLDALGYVVWQRWKVYGEEGLAGREAALWLRENTLTVEHAGEPLSRYAVEFSAGTGKPRSIERPVLFGTVLTLPRPRLFGLESLGEGGWRKTLRLEDYAPRRCRVPDRCSKPCFPTARRGGNFLIRSFSVTL